MQTTAPAATIPDSPKELATQLSLSVQAALADEHRKLEIRLPAGLSFGLFGPAGEQMIGSPDAVVPEATQQRAERELAYLVVEMFQSYQGAVTVVFPDSPSAQLAERDWGRGSLRPRIESSLTQLDARPKAGGFGAAQEPKAVPPKILILVRPEVSDVKAARLPEDGLIVLINPAKGNSKRGYEPVYTLLGNPHPDWKGGLLFRAYPSSWAVGVAGKTGPPRIHGRQDKRPTLAEIAAGFDRVKSDKSLLSSAGGIMSGAGAAAALERRGGAKESDQVGGSWL